MSCPKGYLIQGNCVFVRAFSISIHTLNNAVFNTLAYFDFSASDLSLGKGCPHLIFGGCPHTFLGNVTILPETSLRTQHFTTPSFHYSLPILAFRYKFIASLSYSPPLNEPETNKCADIVHERWCVF